MDEKRIAQVEEIDGRTVRLTTDEGTQDFRVPIRTFWLDAVSLTLVNRMSGVDGAHPDQRKLNRHITGAARMKDTSICVIGDLETRSKSIELSIHPVTESEHKAAIEREAARIARGGETDEWNSFQYNDALLCFQAADWEIPLTASWWIQLNIPESIFEYLWTDVKKQAVSTLHFGVTFRNLYCDDDFSPPSQPVNWFLRPSIRDGDTRIPELAQGTISALSYKNDTARVAGEDEATEEDADDVEPQATDIDEAARRHDETLQALALLSQSIHQIGKIARSAAWVVAIAILLSAFIP
jgi:hypothetical protein